ncbi:hypothetical protein MTR72_11295 [Bradyrhizobium sp. ISRA442]|uniref:hypothetical protein n=1 Tax=Bradyrhizobium sp. ISRA442 TaxID=2866197 RepID=UPI00311B1AC6
MAIEFCRISSSWARHASHWSEIAETQSTQSKAVLVPSEFAIDSLRDVHNESANMDARI